MMRNVGIVLLLLLVLAMVGRGAEEDVGPDTPIVSESAHPDDAVPFFPTPEELDQMKKENPEGFARVKDICMELLQVHHPYLAAKGKHQPERHIFRLAMELGEFLSKKMEAEKVSHHSQFNCEQATEILAHSSATEFQNYLEQFISGEIVPKYSNSAMIDKVKRLRELLITSGLVNEEVIIEIDDIVKDLTELQRLHDALVADFKVVKDPKGSDCSKNFQKYIGELHQLSTEALPMWFHIDQGVQSLIIQCDEDKIFPEDL